MLHPIVVSQNNVIAIVKPGIKMSEHSFRLPELVLLHQSNIDESGNFIPAQSVSMFGVNELTKLRDALTDAIDNWNSISS